MWEHFYFYIIFIQGLYTLALLHGNGMNSITCSHCSWLDFCKDIFINKYKTPCTQSKTISTCLCKMSGTGFIEKLCSAVQHMAPFKHGLQNLKIMVDRGQQLQFLLWPLNAKMCPTNFFYKELKMMSFCLYFCVSCPDLSLAGQNMWLNLCSKIKLCYFDGLYSKYGFNRFHCAFPFALSNCFVGFVLQSLFM